MRRRPALERDAERLIRVFQENAGERVEDAAAPASSEAAGCGGVLIACVVLFVGLLAIAGGPLVHMVVFAGPVILAPLLMMLLIGILLATGSRASGTPKNLSGTPPRKPGSFGSRHR